VAALRSIIGIDMTEEMIKRARFIAEEYGYENI